MSLEAVLLPLFVEVVLTFVLMIRMGILRNEDYRSGRVTPQQIALREPSWPARTTQTANSFSNQFELPVLFYALVILAWMTHHAGIIFVALAWVFVIFRVAQAYVHITSNVVRLRGALYTVSAVALMVMWAMYIVQILSGN